MAGIDEQAITTRFERLCPFMNEKMRRLWAATEAVELGHGGISALSRVTGLNRESIRSGINELQVSDQPPDLTRLRKPGAGRKKLSEKTPELIKALTKLMEPYTSGDPMRPLRWTCKSTQKIASELTALGFKIGPRSVSKLLKDQGYRDSVRNKHP